MFAAAFALIAAFLPRPLPDHATPIDSLTYSFSLPTATLAGGGLTISAGGKVRYHHSTHPQTGSGGHVADKTWELTKGEVAELFRKVVADGLLDAKGDGTLLWDVVRVTSGRWYATVPAAGVPEKAMAHLKPYLLVVPGSPAVKKDAPQAEDKSPAKPGVLTHFAYTFTPRDSEYAYLMFQRDGTAVYRHHVPGADTTEKKWTIPAKEAEALLDALAADGLYSLPAGRNRDRLPTHTVEGHAGVWRTLSWANDRPRPIEKHVVPMLRKNDPEFWK
jgi:hypothetical protein